MEAEQRNITNISTVAMIENIKPSCTWMAYYALKVATVVKVAPYLIIAMVTKLNIEQKILLYITNNHCN